MTGEIVYRLTTADKPGDPADKGADTFVQTVSHRAGYGDDRLEKLIEYLRRQPRATLASGEGALLLAEIDRLRDDLQKQADWADWAKGEVGRSDRAERILAALLEASEALIADARKQYGYDQYTVGSNIMVNFCAAVDAAEQEVGRE